MKIIKTGFKIILAGLLSIVILSIIVIPYSYTPVHIYNDLKNTDYVWPSGSRWIKMTEGISYGKFDENGFNNKGVVENPDIIMVGSSHLEAMNVMQDENAAYLLGKNLNDRYSVYNMGISGHHLYKVCQYLPETLKIYDKTPKAVIIETSDVNLTLKKVEQVIEKTVEFTPSHTEGIVANMQKIPFFRLAYHQIDGGLLNLFLPEKAAQTKDEENSPEKVASKINPDAYDKFFEYLKSVREEYDTEIIIFYHPFETLTGDGSIKFSGSEYVKTFSEYAEKSGIVFLDMTEEFEKMYYEDHYVPHGFSTGKLAEGHLNVYGHKAIADSLADVICELEREGRICR